MQPDCIIRSDVRFVSCCCAEIIVAFFEKPDKEYGVSSNIKGQICQTFSKDANIACLGAFTIGDKLREELVYAFLTNEFEPGCAFQPKVDAMRDYEEKTRA